MLTRSFPEKPQLFICTFGRWYREHASLAWLYIHASNELLGTENPAWRGQFVRNSTTTTIRALSTWSTEIYSGRLNRSYKIEIPFGCLKINPHLSIVTLHPLLRASIPVVIVPSLRSPFVRMLAAVNAIVVNSREDVQSV